MILPWGINYNETSQAIPRTRQEKPRTTSLQYFRKRWKTRQSSFIVVAGQTCGAQGLSLIWNTRRAKSS